MIPSFTTEMAAYLSLNLVSSLSQRRYPYTVMVMVKTCDFKGHHSQHGSTSTCATYGPARFFCIFKFPCYFNSVCLNMHLQN